MKYFSILPELAPNEGLTHRSQLAFPYTSLVFSKKVIVLNQQTKAYLCNPSARGHLPARSEQPGVG